MRWQQALILGCPSLGSLRGVYRHGGARVPQPQSRPRWSGAHRASAWSPAWDTAGPPVRQDRGQEEPLRGLSIPAQPVDTTSLSRTLSPVPDKGG